MLHCFYSPSPKYVQFPVFSCSSGLKYVDIPLLMVAMVPHSNGPLFTEGDMEVGWGGYIVVPQCYKPPLRNTPRDNQNISISTCPMEGMWTEHDKVINRIYIFTCIWKSKVLFWSSYTCRASCRLTWLSFCSTKTDDSLSLTLCVSGAVVFCSLPSMTCIHLHEINILYMKAW